jgi:hypothetical protein
MNRVQVASVVPRVSRRVRVVAARSFTSTPRHSSSVAVYAAPSFYQISRASFCPCILSTPRHDLLTLSICSVPASDLGGHGLPASASPAEFLFLGFSQGFRSKFFLLLHVVSDPHCDFGASKEKYRIALMFKRGPQKHIKALPQGCIPHPSLGIQACNCLLLLPDLVSGHSELPTCCPVNCVL